MNGPDEKEMNGFLLNDFTTINSKVEPRGFWGDQNLGQQHTIWREGFFSFSSSSFFFAIDRKKSPE